MEFKPGDKLTLVVGHHKNFGYDRNRVGHGATVGPRGVLKHDGDLVDIIWDQPSRIQDGGFHISAFAPQAGPW